MALVVKDRVSESSTTTGTGTLILGGALTGFQTFSSAIGNGNTTYYAITLDGEWEVGIGTVGAGTLTRDTVLESSNGGSLVNFSAGAKNVFCTYHAEKTVDIDTAQTLANKTFTSSIPINGSTSGSVTLQALAVAGSTVLTLPATSGTVALYAAPQVTVYTSGSGTYTVPTGAKWLQVEMVGGGAGGGGGGASSGAGGTGGNTTFGSSFLTANGGIGSGSPQAGAGGTATGGDINVTGGSGIQGFDGRTTSQFNPGGTGGASFYGSGAKGGYVTTGGTGGAFGSGGGGGGVSAAQFTGGGGGAGGYLQKIITSPSSTYSYAVGAGGTAGTAGTSGFVGGVGAAGVIIITAYFG